MISVHAKLYEKLKKNSYFTESNTVILGLKDLD